MHKQQLHAWCGTCAAVLDGLQLGRAAIAAHAPHRRGPASTARARHITLLLSLLPRRITALAWMTPAARWHLPRP
jgi:hypothetical protein